MRQVAGSMASRIGFEERAVEEIILVVSELATNLVKHAGGGVLTLTPLSSPDGIEIESLDGGPGIPLPGPAIADGFSTAGSLGYGLGTVNRLMDNLEITTPPNGRGARLVCRRAVRPDGGTAGPFPLTFGVASRPYPGMAVNGDAFVIKRRGHTALAGIIDGLGHGQAAHLAAETARQYVETHFEQPLDALFRGTALACGSTRGVVMALARFDCDSWKLTFASVGNVEARVFGSSQSMGLMVRRGVIGLNAPSPIVTEHPWQASFTMVLHSDGLRTHWRWEDFPNPEGRSAEIIARDLLKALAKENDDATVMVVRGNPS
ncbi:MAG: ATP-binding protein [Actinobacteria bacterium]|nr:ATP-binding protein [Actinomycetota bacterium]